MPLVSYDALHTVNLHSIPGGDIAYKGVTDSTRGNDNSWTISSFEYY